MPPAAGDPATSDSRPNPPRFWWLKRGVIAFAIIAILLLTLRLIDGRRAAARLEGRIATAAAAGDPTRPEELNDDPQRQAAPGNGWQVYTRGLALFDPKIDSPRATNDTFAGPPYPQTWHALADASEAANGPAMVVWESIADATHWSNGVRFAAPMISILLPHLNGMRGSANALCDSAERLHARGDDAAALRRVTAVLAMGDLSAGEPIVVSNLVAVGLRALATSTLQTITPDLSIDTGPPGDPATRPARRPAKAADVRALIARLLDEEPARQGFERAIAGERVFSQDLVPPQLGNAWVTRPIHLRQIERNWAHNTRVLEAFRTTRDAVAAKDLARRSAADENGGGIFFGANWFFGGRQKRNVDFRHSRALSVVTASNVRMIESHYRSLADRRVTAVALAVRLYAYDHPAAPWPATLDALVPAYLPAVPQDPFRPGQPIGYETRRAALPDGRDRPLLYFGGEDNTTPPPPRPAYAWVALDFDNGARQYRDLTLWTPPPEPGSDVGVPQE